MIAIVLWTAAAVAAVKAEYMIGGTHWPLTARIIAMSACLAYAAIFVTAANIAVNRRIRQTMPITEEDCE